MPTYKQIQKYVERNRGFKPKSCWIAHVKEISGLAVKPAWNRNPAERKEPCPPEKVESIQKALRHFGMV